AGSSRSAIGAGCPRARIGDRAAGNSVAAKQAGGGGHAHCDSFPAGSDLGGTARPTHAGQRGQIRPRVRQPEKGKMVTRVTILRQPAAEIFSEVFRTVSKCSTGRASG